MNTARQETGPALVSRLIHASLVAGCVMFALIVHFIVLPNRSDRLPNNVTYALLGAAVIAVVASVAVIRPRVPLKSTNESADLYWSRASRAALITWSVAEAGALLGIVAYLLSASPAAIGVAAIAIGALIWMRPAGFERA